MKKVTWIIVGIILAATLVGITSAAGISVKNATASISVTNRFDLHGVEAEVQSLAATTGINKMIYGTDIFLASGQSTWVFYAVPTPVKSTADNVWVYQFLPLNVQVTQIDVYDGHTMEWTGGPVVIGAGAWSTISRATGVRTYSEAMNIGVKYFNPTANTVRITAGGAGARFTYTF